jgi:hypothetical protein
MTPPGQPANHARMTGLSHALIGVLACGLLNGCAHDQAKPAGNNISQSGTAAPAGQSVTFSVRASTNGILTYQWYANGASIGDTNVSGSTNR